MSEPKYFGSLSVNHQTSPKTNFYTNSNLLGWNPNYQGITEDPNLRSACLSNDLLTHVAGHQVWEN